MTPATYTEADLYAVALAGDPRLRAGDAPTAEEMALVSSCVALEAELREQAWRAFEIVLPHIVDGRVRPPASGPERVRVLAAVVELEWHRTVPVGRAQEAVRG